MATFNIKTGLVKYMNEHTDTSYWTQIAFSLNNSSNKKIYAKCEIINQGNLGWKYDDESTSFTKTLNAGGQYSLTKNIQPSTIPSETQKDEIQIKVSYYADANLTQFLGYDLINIEIHCYIQQSDGSWGSASYPDNIVVFDKLDRDLTGITLGDVQLDNGNAVIKLKAHSGGSLSTDTGVIHNQALVYFADGKKYYYNHYVDVQIEDINGTLITDKFIAFVHKIAYKDGCRLVCQLRNKDGAVLANIPFSTGWKKIIIPATGGLFVEVNKRITLGGTWVKWYLDGLVIFNPL
ncbi:hypothetical protein [Thermococcus sp.]